MLRNATEGWTMPLRREYFQFFIQASRHPGGASFAGFLQNMRAEAEATLTVSERRSLATILGESLVTPLPANITQPGFKGLRRFPTKLALDLACVYSVPSIMAWSIGNVGFQFHVWAIRGGGN